MCKGISLLIWQGEDPFAMDTKDSDSLDPERSDEAEEYEEENSDS